MKLYRTNFQLITPLLFVALVFFTFACGKEEIPIFGEYQEIESGYKNCGPGAFNNQIEVLSDRGICWEGGNFTDCINSSLVLNPDSTFVDSYSSRKYFQDGSEKDGLRGKTTGTYKHDGDIIYLFKNTNFNKEDTLRIDLEGNLHVINASLLNCERHSIFRKI